MVGTQLLEEPTVAPNKPRTADSATPLFIAAYQGLTDVVQAFLRADRSDVKIDLGDIHSVTPLCAAAAWSGSAATTQALLSAGADPSRACFATGSPPLFMAAWGGHLAVVEAMLRLDGVDVNQRRTADGANPLIGAAYNGHAEVVKALLAEATVLPDIAKPGSGNTALFLAASNGHAKTVAAFVECDRVNPNTPNAQSFTPLWVAAERGHADVVRELINWQRVQVNKPNRHLATPLFVAAQKNSVGVIRAVSLHSFCPIWPVIVVLHVRLWCAALSVCAAWMADARGESVCCDEGRPKRCHKRRSNSIVHRCAFGSRGSSQGPPRAIVANQC
eukprot:COSAG01_NODE_1042_length_11958_cov_10.203558_3_plen_332_part_00